MASRTRYVLNGDVSLAYEVRGEGERDILVTSGWVGSFASGALARPGEVLVSSTVKDLVAGSGVAFAERGEHELRGVPGRWRLFAVGSAAA